MTNFDNGCTTATETNLCALCLSVSVSKVIGPLTVKTVVKAVAGHISDETFNDTILYGGRFFADFFDGVLCL